MERSDGQQGKSSGTSKAAVVGAGIVCSVVGAVIGAIGYHVWNNEKQEEKAHSHSTAFNSKGDCPICLEKMDNLTVLECGHQYHRDCAMNLKAYDENPKCPICRKTISD